jgi:hypothetical protein
MYCISSIVLGFRDKIDRKAPTRSNIKIYRFYHSSLDSSVLSSKVMGIAKIKNDFILAFEKKNLIYLIELLRTIPDCSVESFITK